MRQINLLHLKTSANIGGAEVMLTYWPKYLNKERFNQFVIFAEAGPLVKIIGNLGLPVECIADFKGLKGIIRLPGLVSFIRNNKIDLIHAHGARVNLWGSIASLMTGVPIIATEHGIDLWRGRKHIFNMLDRLSAKVNKLRVGVSPAVCEMLKAHGIGHDKVVCINNGIDVERFNISIDVNAKKRELGIPIDARVIGTVGRLVEQKGHRYLLEAAKIVLKELSDTRFIIVGDGQLRYELEEQALSLGIKEEVIFTGQRDDIPELMAIMDIFVLPSITEGLPLVLLEAMAARKPVVASSVSGIPYVIEADINGLLVPAQDIKSLSDKIICLLKDGHKAESLASQGLRTVTDKYNARDMVAKYESVYARAISI